MAIQSTSPLYPSPEQDPSQGRSAAHEIFFGRANVLSNAKSIKQVSVRVALNQIETTTPVQPAVQEMYAPVAVAQVAPEVLVPPSAITESQKVRQMRQSRELVEDALDNDVPINIEDLGDIAA